MVCAGGLDEDVPPEEEEEEPEQDGPPLSPVEQFSGSLPVKPAKDDAKERLIMKVRVAARIELLHALQRPLYLTGVKGASHGKVSLQTSGAEAKCSRQRNLAERISFEGRELLLKSQCGVAQGSGINDDMPLWDEEDEDEEEEEEPAQKPAATAAKKGAAAAAAKRPAAAAKKGAVKAPAAAKKGAAAAGKLPGAPGPAPDDGNATEPAKVARAFPSPSARMLTLMRCALPQALCLLSNATEPIHATSYKAKPGKEGQCDETWCPCHPGKVMNSAFPYT